MNLAKVNLNHFNPKGLAYRVRKELRCICAQYPEFYFSQRQNLYGFVDDYRMINSDTEIVIDGYPCSANTFAEKAFRIAQPREIKMAHHTHDPSQLITAIKANIPTIALIRNPEAVILSYTSRFCDISSTSEDDIAQLIYRLLNDYLDFYRRIIKYKESYIIAEFKTITSAYDSIIEQLNSKYQVNFKPFYCNDSNLEEVFIVIDKCNQARLGNFDENIVARPSSKRTESKEYFRTYLDRSKINKMLNLSYNLYYEITS